MGNHAALKALVPISKTTHAVTAKMRMSHHSALSPKRSSNPSLTLYTVLFLYSNESMMLKEYQATRDSTTPSKARMVLLCISKTLRSVSYMFVISEPAKFATYRILMAMMVTQAE